MRFNRAYASAPLGIPNIGSIFTGKYPIRNNLTNGINIPKPGSRKLLEPRTNQWLDSTETTFVKALQSRGYETAFFGHWKFEGSPQGINADAASLGFNIAEITPKGLSTPANDQHLVRQLTDKSIDFIKQNKKSPFVLFLSHHTVSEPLAEQEDLIANYNEDPLSQSDENNATLGAMIERLDNSIGEIIETLKSQSLLDNTIVIFCSDNGGNQKLISQGNFKGGKGTLYEGGIRIPLIFSWPDNIRSGLVNNAKVSTIDFSPTILALTNASAADFDFDGLDLSKMLLEGRGVSRNTLYWHYPHYNSESGMSPAGAILSSNYKLIEWYEGRYGLSRRYVELYDLEMDPTESENLVRKQPQKADELLKYLQSWRQVMGAKMPSERRMDLGSIQ